MSTIPAEAIKDLMLRNLDTERVSDARTDLTDWLGYAPKDVESLIVTLRRAYAAACTSEPVTAMVILPLIEQARQIEMKLSELNGVRK